MGLACSADHKGQTRRLVVIGASGQYFKDEGVLSEQLYHNVVGCGIGETEGNREN